MPVADRVRAHQRQQTFQFGAPPAVVEAWKKAGVMVGWIAPNENGNQVFSEPKPNGIAVLVAFRFSSLRPGVALHLTGAAIPASEGS